MEDDDWDDGSTSIRVSNTGVVPACKLLMSGRGFKKLQAENQDSCSSSTVDWNDIHNIRSNNAASFNLNDADDGSRRGGRGGRRGRGSHKRITSDHGHFTHLNHDCNSVWECNDKEQHEGWGDLSNNNEYSCGKNDVRGKGGQGKGSTDEKPKQQYIPIERTTDEDLFTTTISCGINFMKLDEIEVNVSGEKVPLPITSFESSILQPLLLENVKKSGYVKLTPIQKHAIPIIINGRDMMGCAQTGSGKTAAFLLPIIHRLVANEESPVTNGTCCQPKVIIVSPTRELTIQIYEQAKKFSYNSTLKIVVAYGGTSVLYQRNKIINGCHILVATPGRLNDFVRRGNVSFASVQFFVLDEADRMLDMGFLPTVEQMLEDSSMVATGERQTLMFSATFPEEVQHLAGKFLHNYIFVAVGIVGSASHDVQQIFYQVTKFQKREKLLDLIRDEKCRTLVFVETKRTADFLATYLSENDIKTTSIHGDRFQEEREQALWDFKKCICRTLVATGVAARGLDIEGIQHVINYDLPNSIDEYVHRIGRTGRLGNKGKASSFFDPIKDSHLTGHIVKILRQASQVIPDWLVNSGRSEYLETDTFGGRDIRDGDFGRAQNFNAHPVEEAEEEW